jgi:hypothetical protein
MSHSTTAPTTTRLVMVTFFANLFAKHVTMTRWMGTRTR